jgi:hypothetical protein
MSLKSFHVFFIVLAILCTLGFACWIFLASGVGQPAALRWWGGVSGVIGILLTGYGIWFIVRKARKIIT